MNYRSQNPPGCGGCLLLFLLFLLLAGGAPLLFRVMGLLVFTALAAVLLLGAAFWGFSYYIKRQVRAYEQSQTEAHNLFVYLLINILTKIAQADGTITKEESEIIFRFFRFQLRYSQSQLYWVRELMKEARRSTADLNTLLTEFKGRFAYEPRLILLELIYQVIFTKIPPLEAELRLAREIALFLEIPIFDQQRIESKYKGRQRQTAAEDEYFYRILGVEPGADFAQIKAAYRKLSLKYHPDKVAHLGEEFRAVAEERMKEINSAYHHLKQKYAR